MGKAPKLGDLGKFEVFVNGRAVKPVYNYEPDAMDRAKREARTHESVTLSRGPKTIASWHFGVRNK